MKKENYLLLSTPHVDFLYQQFTDRTKASASLKLGQINSSSKKVVKNLYEKYKWTSAGTTALTKKKVNAGTADDFPFTKVVRWCSEKGEKHVVVLCNTIHQT